MSISRDESHCPKCDASLREQTDGSIVSADIAHQGERVHEALAKLDQLLDEVKLGVAAQLRLIVGTGLIRDEINIVLRSYLYRKEILDFEQDGQNIGAIMVYLKK